MQRLPSLPPVAEPLFNAYTAMSEQLSSSGCETMPG